MFFDIFHVFPFHSPVSKPNNHKNNIPDDHEYCILHRWKSNVWILKPVCQKWKNGNKCKDPFIADPGLFPEAFSDRQSASRPAEECTKSSTREESRSQKRIDFAGIQKEMTHYRRFLSSTLQKKENVFADSVCCF